MSDKTDRLLMRVDYAKRLIAGVRETIEKEHVEIRKEEGMEECITGTWLDASLLCSVIEKDLIPAIPKDDTPLEEMDVEAFMNIRDWVQEAIEAKGGEITDSGMGAGRADLGFELEGCIFSLHIIPRPLRK